VRKFLSRFIPPPGWNLPVIIMLGILAGILSFLVHVSRAPSYLSDKPSTCTNCHIMAPQYATWSHSSHREAAHCNDCHVPHNNVVNKYYFKAKDGMRHATIFTLRKEPQVIFIKEAGKEAVHKNCIRCHEQLFSSRPGMPAGNEFSRLHTERDCLDCHRETPHGRVNSLSSAPHARVPLPGSPVPEWLNNLIKK
jgi:cytochrome c nitrite reductase small subunit